MSLLVCTDVDRTLLPNGPEPESPGARPAFLRLARREDTRVALVTGRNREQVKTVIEEYDLDEPAFVIANVGTTIYTVRDGHWRHWSSWQERLDAEWREGARADLREAFSELGELEEQEAERQEPFKLSYYTDATVDMKELMGRMRERTSDRGVDANLISSVDVSKRIGLIDVLPPVATKLHALEHVLETEGLDVSGVVFAGDSGNDLEILTSRVPAVLVANASAEVREEAIRRSAVNGTSGALHLAMGGFLGMNGNYAAGLLEGVAHFRPELGEWLEAGG